MLPGYYLLLLPLFPSIVHSLPNKRNTAKRNSNSGDRGPGYGNVMIINSCPYDLYMHSQGAYELYHNEAKGQELKNLPSGETYSEYYRETCPFSGCNGMDKEPGQGIALKISFEDQQFHFISQFEYSLQQNPIRDDFPRLDFDVSLVDCGRIDSVTDIEAEEDDWYTQNKVTECPGYENGFAVWFDDHTICRPVYCDGVHYCDGVYNYDRTRAGEMSLACDQEYIGNMYIELCVGNGNG